MTQLALVHILDLASEGWIKPHIDSVRVIRDYFYSFKTFFFACIFKISLHVFLPKCFTVLWGHYCRIKFAD